MSESDHVVTDTHALIWHLRGTSDLSASSRSIFARADAGQIRVYVPSICLIEAIYLVERARVPAEIVDIILSYIDAPDRPYWLATLDPSVIHAARSIPRDLIPDMPDRIIAATARALGYPLVSADGRIQSAGVVEVIW